MALRIPNHFRAIFGEGAFNSAFVPTYAKVLEQEGAPAARSFANRITTLMLIVQVVLLGVALAAMPFVVILLAPGFPADPAKFDLAVTLTRITFPYLLFITLVTVLSGVLNANGRFAAAAAAPVLLNAALVAALALSFLFPTAGTRPPGASRRGRAGTPARLCRGPPGARTRLGAPRLDPAMRTFFRTLGPAVIGSAGVQIAMFADTIIASLLPTGAVSSLYYADRLYQLPVGVIGIAAGTVLLPEMSRRIAAGDVAGAHAAQNRTVGFTLALTAPFLVAFLVMPDLIMAALFQRGAFDAAAAERAGAVLAAYAVGLPAVVLIRSAVASFYARSDTTTPLIASLTAVAVNVAPEARADGPVTASSASRSARRSAPGSISACWSSSPTGGTGPPPTPPSPAPAWRSSSRPSCSRGSRCSASRPSRAPPVPSRPGAARRWSGSLGAAGAVLYGVALLAGLRVLGVRLSRR